VDDADAEVVLAHVDDAKLLIDGGGAFFSSVSTSIFGISNAICGAAPDWDNATIGQAATIPTQMNAVTLTLFMVSPS
jgi:hypothetical protein